MQKAKVKQYRWDATGDRLTCPACRSMDGRVFDVAEAVRVLDTLEDAKDPQMLKELRPIVTTVQKGPSKDIKTKTPPLHPQCRCRIVMQIDSDLPVMVERPAGVPYTPAQRELEEEFNALKKQEIVNKLMAHQGSSWLRPMGKGVKALKRAEREARGHYLKHKDEFGNIDLEQYQRMAIENIKNPDQVYVTLKGRNYCFVKGDTVTLSRDDDLRIVSFYRFHKDVNDWVRRNAQDGIIRIL